MTLTTIGIHSTSGLAALLAFLVLVIVMSGVLGGCTLFVLAIDTHRRPGHLEGEDGYKQYEYKAFHRPGIVPSSVAQFIVEIRTNMGAFAGRERVAIGRVVPGFW